MPGSAHMIVSGHQRPILTIPQINRAVFAIDTRVNGHLVRTDLILATEHGLEVIDDES